MRSPGEVVRRVYGDLVRRRSVVRIVSSDDAPESLEDPIFLIGAYRSGTTLLRYIVDSHPRICCPPESDFMIPLVRVLDDERSVSSLEMMGFDRAHQVRRVRAFAEYYFGNFRRTQGKDRWADKTPSYIDILPQLHSVFPTARFVMLYRHGLNQAHSMTRGGTITRPILEPFHRPDEDLRLGGTRYWVDAADKMMAFEAANPTACHRVIYEDLCRDPEGIVPPIFEFLGEPFVEQVLRYYEFDHVAGREDGRVQATRAIEPSEDHVATWPTDVAQACRELAARPLRDLGYEQ